MPDAQTSSDKLKLFISYSRRNMTAADALVVALEGEGFAVTIDRRDLPYGEEWQKELADFIRGSDTVVWLVSPDSIASKWCNWELGEVGRLHKRLVPVKIGVVVPEQLPEALGKIHLLPVEGVYDAAAHLSLLVTALNTDRAWVKEATRLADHAREWITSERSSSLLLRGPSIASAEKWSTRRPTMAPPPATDVLELILASRRGAVRRQRWWAIGGFAAAAIGIGLATVAWLQRDAAIANEERAKKERDQALTTQSRFLADLGGQYAEANDDGTAVLFALAGLPDTRATVTRPLVKEPAILLEEGHRSIREVKVLSGHTSGVASAAFSPDGQNIVTASQDTTARVWDVGTGKETAVLQGHQGMLMGAAFSHDGQRIVTASLDQTARVWDRTGRQIAILSTKRPVKSAELSPDGRRVLITTSGEPAQVWNIEPPRQIAVLPGASSGVAFSRDGSRIVGPSGDNTARLWDGETGKEVKVFTGHQYAVKRAAFSPDGRRVVTVSSDNTARIWDTATGREVKALTHQGVDSAAFSPNGRRVVTASTDGTARVWDVQTGDEVQVFEGHPGPVRSAMFSPDGERVLTVSHDKARLWDVESRNAIAVLSGHLDGLTDAAFGPDGQHIMTASSDHTVRLWSAGVSQKIDLPCCRHVGGTLMRPVFGPDRRHIIVESWGGGARVLEVPNEKEVALFEGHPGRVRQAALRRDGRRIVTVSEGEARLWDVDSDKTIAVLAAPESKALAAAFSPDGTRVVTAHSDGTVRLWNTSNGSQIGVLGRHAGGVNSATYSPDGRQVVTASEDGTARLWDAEGNKQIAVFSGHRSGVNRAVFSPDGRQVVTLSEDEARLWEAATARLAAVLSEHDGDVLVDADITLNGRRVVTSSANRKMRMWDAETGTEVATLSWSGQVDWSFAFSLDGKSIIAASATGDIRAWNVFLTTQDLVDHTKSVIPRCLTRTQRDKAFLDPVPPAWCITGTDPTNEARPSNWNPKWPYDTPEWKQWLLDTRAGKNSPLPYAP